VTDVPEGPAMDAGMKAGDVITAFNGVDVADTRELVRRVADTDVGKAVPVVVLRDGKSENLTITLGRRETAEGEPVNAAVKSTEPTESELLGMTLTVLTPEEVTAMGLTEGTEGLVVKAIDEAGDAYGKGLRAGDVITEAGQQKVASLKDLEDRVAEAKDAGRKSLLLLIRREGEPRFVAVSLE
jgi:serine protease Do